ncbi:GNAT family N-acetyltransferase [Mucilaginibacter gynuensis]|uniref:GNAT family N-acetyltransferase n=1 Tax=Mucilaginibacter gynuensis TaxID=1302236 RepID=A0ABP8HIS0_9SPHI
MDITYQAEENLQAEEFKALLIKSTLGERRPIDDIERIEKMCRNAGLIVTARADGQLVGVARSVTDWVYCTYLSDLAVDEAFQHRGIGKKLIAETKRLTPQATLILLAAPAAVGYYPKIGMTNHEHCYLLRDVNDLK